MRIILISLTLVAAIALVFSVPCSGQVRVETRIAVSNEFGKVPSVMFGMDSTATDSLDQNLGEFALPGFPPTGLHAAFLIADNGERVLSYSDLRPYPKEKSFVKEHEIALSPAGDSSRGTVLTFEWHYPFHPYIDSITISDPFDLYKVKLERRERDTLKGSLINLEKFILRAFYTVRTVDVQTSQEVPVMSISMNPVENELILLGFTDAMYTVPYSIYNSLGVQVLKGNLSSHIIVSELPAASYTLVVAGGMRTFLRFVKI